MNRLKKILIGGFIFLSALVNGQSEGLNYSDENGVYVWTGAVWDTIAIDTSICAERGHVMTGAFSTTLLHCPSYIVDHEDYSEEVFPVCNTRTSVCRRCGIEITELDEERRVIIWKRPVEKEIGYRIITGDYAWPPHKEESTSRKLMNNYNLLMEHFNEHIEDGH